MRCPNCNFEAPTVMVHGHIQCTACKVNIGPCCDGAIELQWHPYDAPIPEGWHIAQDVGVHMHHNNYAFMIGRDV
jgi:hypothetical protein